MRYICPVLYWNVQNSTPPTEQIGFFYYERPPYKNAH
jgi:hypothetical protein